MYLSMHQLDLHEIVRRLTVAPGVLRARGARYCYGECSNR